MYREFKKTPTDSSNCEARKINLRTYNVIIKRSIFIAKKTYYHHIFQKYSSDIKNTWSIIKNLLHKKKKSNLSPNKIKIDNILNANIELITNSFNKYFVNIGPDLALNIKDPTPNSYKTFLKNLASSRFPFELVNENTVSKIMDNLSTKKSCGFDELSTHLIKSIKSEILGPLTITIYQSLVTGIFPNKLKITRSLLSSKKVTLLLLKIIVLFLFYQHYQKLLSVSFIIKTIITLFLIICIMSVNMASEKTTPQN